MSNLCRKYTELSFEQKMIVKTILCLCCSAILSSGKLIIGLFIDYNLCIIAVYTFTILLAKLVCIIGLIKRKRDFKRYNLIAAILLFLSSIFYNGYMCKFILSGHTVKEYSIVYVCLFALISFSEFGFAIAGILQVKDKGLLFRDIKIINLCIALIAILTTQTTILDYNSATKTVNTDIFNAYTGIGVSGFIALCSIYILIAPKINVTGKEHNVFFLQAEEKNALINLNNDTVEISLCRSFIYGSYVYRAKIEGKQIDGNIERDKSLWKRMPLWSKIICCILSEILIFVWLIGRLIFFLRSINLPKRLKYKMNKNGFAKVGGISELSQSKEAL